MNEFRPVVTLHLPVPMDFFIAVQRVFMEAYPELADAPASKVMLTDDTAVTFLAPEPS